MEYWQIFENHYQVIKIGKRLFSNIQFMLVSTWRLAKVQAQIAEGGCHSTRLDELPWLLAWNDLYPTAFHLRTFANNCLFPSTPDLLLLVHGMIIGLFVAKDGFPKFRDI
jgi:hypothetical protein